ALAHPDFRIAHTAVLPAECRMFYTAGARLRRFAERTSAIIVTIGPVLVIIAHLLLPYKSWIEIVGNPALAAGKCPSALACIVPIYKSFGGHPIGVKLHCTQCCCRRQQVFLWKISSASGRGAFFARRNLRERSLSNGSNS